MQKKKFHIFLVNENYHLTELDKILLDFKEEFEIFFSSKIVNILKETIQEVYEPCLYSLLNGGKRIRPILFLLASEYHKELEPEKKEELLFIASAIEVLHTYTLIHDDLPAMDNDPIRRGKPSCHIKYPEWAAILAGDTLNTFAFYLLSFSKVNLKKKLEILSLSLGHKGVIAGQALDLSNEKKNFLNPTKDFRFILTIFENQKILDTFKVYLYDHKFLKLLSIHYLKTAIFFKAIMQLGFYSRFEKEIEIKDLKLFSEYGESIGLLFQISDDMLDEIGEESLVGKKLHKDQSMGKLTFPSLLGIEKTQEIALELCKISIDVAYQFSNFLYKSYLLNLPKYIIERKK